MQGDPVRLASSARDPGRQMSSETNLGGCPGPCGQPNEWLTYYEACMWPKGRGAEEGAGRRLTGLPRDSAELDEAAGPG